ncbi:cytochrome P450 [Xylaria palmicola]|nr:cytochrome P450 [Xylaria palmicola]
MVYHSVVVDLGALCLLLILGWHIAKRDILGAHQQRSRPLSNPSTFPSVFPLLGSLPIAYLWKPRDFVLSPDNFFQSPDPTRVKILTQEFFVVRGSENVKTLFKNSWVCTSIPFVKFALGYAFGLPPKALSLYDKDDSGGGHVPHPDSTVEARNRIDYRVHQSLADLMKVVGDEATVSIINALCGPYLLALNPHFLQDFWSFDRNLQTYLQGIPWLLAPKAHAARKRVLDAVKAWQQHAREHYTDSAVGADGDDPFWGSHFFRERHEMFLEMDGFDYAAIASQDFGAIWAARNSVTAASWVVFDIYRDPELLASVRAEVDSFWARPTAALTNPPAVYAETLRLRMHFYIIRMADRADMKIRDWIIPKRKVVVTPTTAAHMDTETWCTGSNNEHPLDQFWIGRFLKYPSDSDHGNAPPTFSTKELEGSWIPYGGGPRQCPGRHFAKRQIVLTAALMVSLFDCEILGEGKDVKEDFTLKGFGGGVSHPAGEVPIRIRRRRRDDL